jgi:hypothetical protein
MCPEVGIMRSRVLLRLCVLLMSAAVFAQGSDTNWVKLPEGRAQMGAMHGDLAVSSAGEVYVSVEGSVTQRFAILGPNPGLQVYAPDGRFLRNVPGRPARLHHPGGTGWRVHLRCAAGVEPRTG